MKRLYLKSLYLFGLCVFGMLLSCSSGSSSEGEDAVSDAADTFEDDASGDTTADIAEPECTVDSDCAKFVTSSCRTASCNEGVCEVANADNGTSCDDGNGCTQTDSCQAGVCTGTDPVTCPAPDQCHDTGICDPETGLCSNPAEVDGTLCDDGDLCTRTDTCQAGLCTGSNDVVCEALDQCHDAGTCDSATGLCSNPTKADDTACDDGNAATGGDSCQGGLCLGEGCICNTIGACCDGCLALNEAGACSDGDLCTQTDACVAGFCVGSNPVVCAALDQCHEVGICDTTTGVCSNPNKADDTLCDDGDLCNGVSTCQAGSCDQTTDPVVCVALDQCHEVGICDTTTGVCSNPTKADTTSCDDANEGTGADKCQSGVCTGTPCTCATTDTCCDGCLGINQGAKCWEGTQYGGLCTAAGACHDPSRWAVVALNNIGISIIDTENDVVYGPFLDGWLGTDGGGRFDVVVSPDGTTAAVSNFGDSTVHFIDLANPTDPLPTGSLRLPMFAEDMAFTADGRFILVTDGGFSKYIVVIDAATRTIVEAFSHKDVLSNAVATAPDGTVLVADYFAGKIHSLRLDDQGHLTYVDSYSVFITVDGDISPNPWEHQIRPVNVFIAPDGKTVLVPDVAKYNETPQMDDPNIDTGFAYYSLLVFEITSPGVLTLHKNIKKVPASAQSVAFSDDGKHAYILGNNLKFRSDMESDYTQLDDHMLVLDVDSTGEFKLNTQIMPSLKRTTTSQLFGVDNIAVSKGKAYLTHPTVSGATKNVSVVDLATYKVTRLAMGDLPIGIAVVPMNSFDVPFVPGPATCDGICGSMNQAAHCGCDEACQDWNDCCTDVDLVCHGCDSETCKDWNRVCEMLPDGTYGCGCTWGYVYQAGNCIDIDECALGTHNCIEGTTCENTDGSYWCRCPDPLMWDSFGSCLCPSGYMGDIASGCTDIDECADGTGPCKEGATCVNNDGGYECTCELPRYSDGMDGCSCDGGFEWDGVGACLDIDECALGTAYCHDGASCENTEGSYNCNCKAPYQPDYHYGCICPEGYEINEYDACVDIDECAPDVVTCHDGAACQNFDGGYDCACTPPLAPDGDDGCYCPEGYRIDETGACVDIDECAEGLVTCYDDAVCENTEGSYSCTCTPPLVGNGSNGCACPSGYQWDDGSSDCVDIDECNNGSAYCYWPSWCENTEGSYTCACEYPFVPNYDHGCMCADGYCYDDWEGYCYPC